MSLKEDGNKGRKELVSVPWGLTCIEFALGVLPTLIYTENTHIHTHAHTHRCIYAYIRPFSGKSGFVTHLNL